jgi:PHB/PHA accumulation regulator DNA-binding domain
VGDLDQMLETSCLDEKSKRAVAIKLSAAREPSMMEPVNPVVIKKYGNRRLYNTATSAYEIGGECVAHRLFIAMSDIGRHITRIVS